MSEHSWNPYVSFGIDNEKIYILIEYATNNQSIRIHHHDWIVCNSRGDLDFAMVPYSELSSTLASYLYLDLKNRPAVHNFLKSGPPGDRVDDRVGGAASIQNLVATIMNTVFPIYKNFIQHY
jgi:hypothetical protein